MNCKLIVSDLDGTLLDSKGNLSPENSKAITELAKKGILFVPATGRAFYEIPECIRNHPDIKYFISSNGAVIHDFIKGERSECFIDASTARELHSKMNECNFWIIHHKNDCAFTEALKLSKDVMDEYNIPQKFQNQLIDFTKPVDNLDDNLSDCGSLAMICGCFASYKEREIFTEKIKDMSKIHCTASSSFILEIVNENAGKHNAVASLCKKLGFLAENIITVGDSRNDLEMIKMSKNSVAVSNAMEIIKENAGHIGPSNDEHILKFILENYI